MWLKRLEMVKKKQMLANTQTFFFDVRVNFGGNSADNSTFRKFHEQLGFCFFCWIVELTEVKIFELFKL